jgi:hypothetical protein
MGENAAQGMRTNVTFASVIFLFLIDFTLSLLNLLPSFIARSVSSEWPMSGQSVTLAVGVNYATFYVFFAIPYGFLTGSFDFASLPMVGSIAAYIVWAVLSYMSAYRVISMPRAMKNPENEMAVPLNDSEKCLAALGDFMAILTPMIGEHRKMEKLWSGVYVYLRDLPKIQKFVREKGLRHDEIVLNAVGNIAFTMLARGEFHLAFGTLSPDGEYVRKVWWIAANELAKRSYCGPEDVTRGLSALDEAIVSVGARQ